MLALACDWAPEKHVQFHETHLPGSWPAPKPPQKVSKLYIHLAYLLLPTLSSEVILEHKENDCRLGAVLSRSVVSDSL